jgi:hypothetical protein
VVAGTDPQITDLPQIFPSFFHEEHGSRDSKEGPLRRRAHVQEKRERHGAVESLCMDTSEVDGNAALEFSNSIGATAHAKGVLDVGIIATHIDIRCLWLVIIKFSSSP